MRPTTQNFRVYTDYHGTWPVVIAAGTYEEAVHPVITAGSVRPPGTTHQTARVASSRVRWSQR